jgi:hypothetical protein
MLGAVLRQSLEQTQLKRLHVGMVMLLTYRHYLHLCHCFHEGFKGKRSLRREFDHSAMQLGSTRGS